MTTKTNAALTDTLAPIAAASPNHIPTAWAERLGLAVEAGIERLPGLAIPRSLLNEEAAPDHPVHGEIRKALEWVHGTAQGRMYDAICARVWSRVGKWHPAGRALLRWALGELASYADRDVLGRAWRAAAAAETVAEMDARDSASAKASAAASAALAAAAQVEANAAADAYWEDWFASMYITTTQAADIAGMLPSSFRATMSRLRSRGQADMRAPQKRWPDARTPLWDADAVRAWVESGRIVRSEWPAL